MDECADASTCGDARCRNLPGSFSCLCDVGYAFSPQDKACRGATPGTRVQGGRGTWVSLGPAERCWWHHPHAYMCMYVTILPRACLHTYSMCMPVCICKHPCSGQAAVGICTHKYTHSLMCTLHSTHMHTQPSCAHPLAHTCTHPCIHYMAHMCTPMNPCAHTTWCTHGPRVRTPWHTHVHTPCVHTV